MCSWVDVQAASGAIVSAVHREPLDAVDRDLDVLAAGGEDLVVEQRVPRVPAERLHRHVLGEQASGRIPIISMCEPVFGGLHPRLRSGCRGCPTLHPAQSVAADLGAAAR